MSPTARNAVAELRALAEAMRPDWDPRQLDGLFVTAAQAGWTFRRTLIALVPVLCDEDGQPSDLERAIAASRKIIRGTALPEDRNADHAAEVREAMHEGLARLRHHHPQPEPAAEGEVA